MYTYQISKKDLVSILKIIPANIIPLSITKNLNLYEYLSLQCVGTLTGIFFMIFSFVNFSVLKSAMWKTLLFTVISSILLITSIITIIYTCWICRKYIADWSIIITENGISYKSKNHSIEYYWDMLHDIKVLSGDICIRLNNMQGSLILPKSILKQNETYKLHDYIDGKIKQSQCNNEDTQDVDDSDYKTNLH